MSFLDDEKKKVAFAAKITEMQLDEVSQLMRLDFVTNLGSPARAVMAAALLEAISANYAALTSMDNSK